MYGYIYLTTNLINSRKYIGQHKSECFDTNYYGSGKVLLQAINAYGKDNFKCEILCECFSAEELNAKEEFYIVYDNLRLAANDVGAKSTGNICSCLKGNRPHAMGYHWEYVD